MHFEGGWVLESPGSFSCQWSAIGQVDLPFAQFPYLRCRTNIALSDRPPRAGFDQACGGRRTHPIVVLMIAV